MEPQPIHFQALVKLLQSWAPISSHFRQVLYPAIQFQEVKPKQQLSTIGTRLQTAWFSIDCWIAASHALPNGRVEITTLYAPHEIFTSIESFLMQHTSQHQISIIQGSMLLKIDRTHFEQLRVQKETTTLLEHYLMLEQQKSQWRMDLLVLPDQQKFNLFAKRYPIDQLPGKVCASYLRMTPSRYSAAKSAFYRNRL